MAGNESVEIFVSVPQDCMGLVIGTGKRNINRIKQETRTRIRCCNGGFIVTGTENACGEAGQAIQCRIDNSQAKLFESVPQQFARLLITKNAADNFRVIEGECGVKIFWEKFSEGEEHVTFTIKGLRRNCEHAREMLRANLKKWEDTPRSQRTWKINDEVQTIDMYIENKYMSLVVGINHRSIDRVATKSGTKIKVPSRRCAEAQGEPKVKLEITGSPKNCLRAQSLIKSHIVSFNDKIKRNEYGRDTHFVCFACADDSEEFRFIKSDKSAPKLDGFIHGQRFRIESLIGDFEEDQSEISEKTILEIKDHLLKPLESLEKMKDEKDLIADLWCHFGKVLVCGVDEEIIKDVVTPEVINKRLIMISSNDEIKSLDAYWKASFEVGVNPSHVKDDALSNSEGESRGILGLKLIHSQWRYDFGFTTPSYRNVRLKAWEGLPPGNDKPPDEVKNILHPVALDAKESIRAWICYPSTSVLRGEIMIPNSQYDCRMKLRVGSRRVTDKDSTCIEEDATLSDYLSKCKFDEREYRMHLPDEKAYEMPEGFVCRFYREANERIFEATIDEESYTVVLWDEKGWDSDSSEKRLTEQFGIRVVMNSWSEAMLFPEQQWTTEEILEKLEKYMDFLFLLKDNIFHNE